MAKHKKEDNLIADPDGATFVSSDLVTFRTSDDALETAQAFENLAFSRTLINPKVALRRAHQLLNVAVALENEEKTKK